MKYQLRAFLTLSLSFFLYLSVGGRAMAAAPAAPTLVSPADGASVTEPFTISWSAVGDPSGIAAYNWQVSASSAFTTVILLDSTSGATQDEVSGLANGTYFWRVQAVNGAFEQGAWSQPRSFTVTGAGSGSPGTPSLGPPRGYSTFHPYEVMTLTWSPVADAATYVLQFATDPSFPVVTRGEFNNIPQPTMSFAIGNPEGNYFARVFAVGANGTFSAPSNVITFSVFFNNPLPPPPSPISPVNNPTLTLPITIRWTDVPNPQPSGYELQIARDSNFRSIELDEPQLNDPVRQVISLTSGTKFWRVRSAQGNASETTAAVTDWSQAGTFTISSAPPVPVSVALAKDPLYSGETTWVAVQLTTAVPAGGGTISLTSSNPSAFPVPSAIPIQGNTAWTQFQVHAGQVTVATPVTITASLNSGSATANFNLQPSSLASLTISPSTITGGAQPQCIIMLNGQAPASGATLSLSSNSPFVSPPATVNVEAGSPSVSFPLTTSAVSTNTTATVTATYNGATVSGQVTLVPGIAPASISLDPTEVLGLGGSSFATVRVATAPTTDQMLQVTSSNPTVASVPNGVMIPRGSTTGGFNIFTSAVSSQTLVTISVSGAGVTRSATLIVDPQAPPPTPGAATLLSPANDATVGQPITFDWTDATNAASYEIQVDDSSNFTAPLTRSQTVAASQAVITDLPAQRLFWRVRGINSAGVAGPFSASRRFTARSSPPTSASLSSVTVSPTTIVGGSAAQGTVALTAAAPAGGAVVSLTSSNTSAATVSASVTVPAGSSVANFSIATSAVTANTSVGITAAYAGVSRTATLIVTPAGPPPPPPPTVLPAPSLLSPAADARFSPGTGITFDWTDVSGAAGYTIQIDSDEAFSAPQIVNQTTTASQFVTAALPTTRMWFRVRANAADGTPGNWSSSRRFEVKQ